MRESGEPIEDGASVRGVLGATLTRRGTVRQRNYPEQRVSAEECRLLSLRGYPAEMRLADVLRLAAAPRVTTGTPERPGDPLEEGPASRLARHHHRTGERAEDRATPYQFGPSAEGRLLVVDGEVVLVVRSQRSEVAVYGGLQPAGEQSGHNQAAHRLVEGLQALAPRVGAGLVPEAVVAPVPVPRGIVTSRRLGRVSLLTR